MGGSGKTRLVRKAMQRINCFEKVKKRNMNNTAVISCVFDIQMAHLTTAVSEEEVVKHFREVLAPYVIETQLVGGLDNSISPSCSKSTTGSGKGRMKFSSSQDFIDNLTDILQSLMKGLTKKEVPP